MGIRRSDNNYIIEKEINTLDEYIGYIKQEKNNYGGELWFRGQRDSSWYLEPSLYRDSELNVVGDEISRLHRELNIDFLKELKLFKDHLIINGERYNDFHYMFLGQHYNLKTPALDWTTDPLVALFFALDESNGKDSPLVFVLHPEEINKYNYIVLNKSDRIMKPLNIDNINNADEMLKELYSNDSNTTFTWAPLAVRSDNVKVLSQRISRQSGVFTMMSPIPRLDMSWINHSFKDKGNDICFGKVVSINPSKAAELKSDLRILDIYKETIMLKDTEEMEKKCMNASAKARIEK